MRGRSKKLKYEANMFQLYFILFFQPTRHAARVHSAAERHVGEGDGIQRIMRSGHGKAGDWMAAVLITTTTREGCASREPLLSRFGHGVYSNSVCPSERLAPQPITHVHDHVYRHATPKLKMNAVPPRTTRSAKGTNT